jgi:hypothetical protein
MIEQTEKCPWKRCGLPATEDRSVREEQWGGFLGRKRLPDRVHDLWLCPKHARWHDHPEEQEPEVPTPYFVDGIKVAEVDVEWDYDAQYPPHQPAEWDIRELAQDGDAAAIRVRFWRANPHQNGYQSYDLQHCDVVQALAWANKKVAPVPGASPERGAENQFAGGTFQLGLYLPDGLAQPEPEPDPEPDPVPSSSVGDDAVIWLYGDNPLMGGTDD